MLSQQDEDVFWTWVPDSLIFLNASGNSNDHGAIEVRSNKQVKYMIFHYYRLAHARPKTQPIMPGVFEHRPSVCSKAQQALYC